MRRRVHIVGIGGTGLSAIARVLHERGERVTGSDQAVTSYSRALEALGIPVHYGHAAENVVGADVVLVSSAVAEDNPEVAAARRNGIRVVRRQGFLGELTEGLRVVAVAGTHGKTTTSSLIAWTLVQAGMKPGFILGGVPHDLGTNAQAGAGAEFVIEADEYDYAFLGLTPQFAIVTNVEHDHPDVFPTPADVRAAFQQFVDRVQDRLLVCIEDPVARELGREGLHRQTYGFDEAADWRAEEVRPNNTGGMDFLAVHAREVLGLFRTRLPGRHNVLNALAAVAAADWLGLSMAVVRQALTDFRGVGRRFEVVGEVGQVVAIDDYAHHPSEVRATLEAARQRYPGHSIWAVFQPHTYSRTRALADEFAQAFSGADHVVVTEVFAARERPDPAAGGRVLAERILQPDVHFASDLEEAAAYIVGRLASPAVVVTLSAGDANVVGRRVLEMISAGGKERGRDERA
ncbi:MAG TPA: UDP-N-acetylmuramate--L-alanine ligase [Anaerolineales bacterium]|nr:UDP-N-acetylmuramate--L-alanine ligase [Anaerolineales bacterium]